MCSCFSWNTHLCAAHIPFCFVGNKKCRAMPVMFPCAYTKSKHWTRAAGTAPVQVHKLSERAHTHTHTYTHAHTCTYARTYTCTCARTHACTHTHMHACACPAAAYTGLVGTVALISANVVHLDLFDLFRWQELTTNNQLLLALALCVPLQVCAPCGCVPLQVCVQCGCVPLQVCALWGCVPLQALHHSESPICLLVLSPLPLPSHPLPVYVPLCFQCQRCCATLAQARRLHGSRQLQTAHSKRPAQQA